MISNVSYLGLMQIVNYVFPFITIPYLVKTLGGSGFGTYSLALIIMSYLGILIDYGFNLTATREVAIHKNNKDTIDHLVSGVFYIKAFLMSIIFLIGLTLYLSHVVPPPIILAVLIFSIGQALFPVWLFQGMEDMGTITVFNTCSKVISTVSIFFLVKERSDTPMATVFYSLGIFIAGLMSFSFALRKYHVRFCEVTLHELKKLVINGFDIFLTSFFSNVIISGGALVLGFFGGAAAVGVYSAIEKIARSIIGVLSAVTQVIFPGVARTLARDKQEGLQKIKRIGGVFILVLSLGCLCFILISEQVLNLLYGDFYREYAYALNILLIWVIFSFVNNFLGIQFLVGSGNNKYYRKAFLLSSIYMIASFAGIRFFYMDGLLFSILSGEIFLTLSMLYLIKKNHLILNAI